MAFRVFTQINFSAGENPDGDSGFHFTCDLIQAIINIDENFHFYILIPNKNQDLWKSKLNHTRITLIPINIARRSHGGEFQFAPEEILESFNFRKYEVDCLFLNQPELVNAYVNLFNKLLFHCVPAISYVHWFDTRNVGSKQNIQNPALLSALTGMITSNVIGVNSAFGKRKIVEESQKWFNYNIANELASKISILPPGINTKEIDMYNEAEIQTQKKTILINHRLLTYTGVRNLLTNTFPKLWEIRKDFCVLVTNPSKVRLPLKIKNSPWLINCNFSRPEYFRILRSCDIVVSPHKATHWSMSTIEAIYAGCIPLMNKNSFFPELFDPLLEFLDQSEIEHIENICFYSNNNFFQKINYLLDNISIEKQLTQKLRGAIQKTYDWSIIANKWISLFYDLQEKTHEISPTNPSLSKIIDLINLTGSISKQEILRELSWGPQSSTLSWTAFRKRLNKSFFDDSNSSDVIYKII